MEGSCDVRLEGSGRAALWKTLHFTAESLKHPGCGLEPWKAFEEWGYLVLWKALSGIRVR